MGNCSGFSLDQPHMEIQGAPEPCWVSLGWEWAQAISLCLNVTNKQQIHGQKPRLALHDLLSHLVCYLCSWDTEKWTWQVNPVTLPPSGRAGRDLKHHQVPNPCCGQGHHTPGWVGLRFEMLSCLRETFFKKQNKIFLVGVSTNQELSIEFHLLETQAPHNVSAQFSLGWYQVFF